MADGVRDPEELLHTDGFAMSKRTHGFVPKTLFYKEESANRAYVPPVSPFQDFGVPSLKDHFRSIDEHASSLEMTLSDEVEKGHEWLQAHGYVRPAEVEPRKTQWLPAWPPILHLVEVESGWKSVVFEEDLKKKRELEEREAYDRKIRLKCPRCEQLRDDLVIGRVKHKSDVSGTEVAIEHYFHVNSRTAIRCPAEPLHEERGTVVRVIEVA